MSITGTLVVFVICWWLCFFVVLPIGVRGQFEDGEPTPGTEEGAPAEPMLKKKALWATIGGVILTAIVAFIMPHLVAG